MQKLLLDYENFKNSSLAQEFDRKGKMNSFSEYVTKNCKCNCVFNDNYNQEDSFDDSWILTFNSEEDLISFCTKYNFSAENGVLNKVIYSKKNKLK